jgi:hypothetical protein
MSPLRLNGSTSGYSQLDAPAIAGDQTFTLPGTGGTIVTAAGAQTLTNKTIQGGSLTLATAQASTSGTSIDFTGIPSWVKRVTVMFAGTSTNGNNPLLVQIGAGSITTSGYSSGASAAAAGPNVASLTSTVGFAIVGNSAYLFAGSMILNLVTGNTWVSSHSLYSGTGATGGGVVTLSGTLDRLRIIGSTTGSPTDTFDAGSINILYEG